jgi:hypothetical protein
MRVWSLKIGASWMSLYPIYPIQRMIYSSMP